MMALISKALGLAVVLGATVVKFPQIFTIWKGKSANGLSFPMFGLDLLRHPFSVYGETVFMALQNAVIIYLIFKFDSSRSVASLVPLAVTYLAGAGVLVSGIVPLSVMKMLYSLVLPISIISRFPQIWSNFKNKGCGQLSLVSTFLIFGGSLARVFTTFQDTDSMLMLASCVLASVLNGVLLLQIVMYGEGKVAKVAKKTK